MFALTKSIRYLILAPFLWFISLSASATTEVYILHTNNTNGALENCLCPGKSYGSLEKRIVYVRNWLRRNPNTLVLDAGDFLSASRNSLKDSIAFRGYELIPYDAVGLGDQEFFRGVSFFADLAKRSSLPFVATNLVKPDFPFFRKEIIVIREGISFGILSVMDPEVFQFFPKNVSDMLEVEPFEAVLTSRIAELERRVDVVILLSHLGIDKDRELATSIPGIDVIVGGHTQSVLSEPEQVGNSIIVQAGKDGYYVGELRLQFSEESGEGEAAKILNYDGKLVPMDISLPNDSTMVSMIVDYNRLSQLRAGKRVERIVPIPSEYLVASTGRCSPCHQEQIAHWLTTPHAEAFETLKEGHKEKSPECLACHTTGFGRDDGYLNYNITAGLKNVSCTECHYVPVGHLVEPFLNPPNRVAQEKCLRCHDQANSPRFDFVNYMAGVRHPVVGVAVEVPETIIPEASVEFIEAPPEAEPELIVHRVQAGETLWSLAAHYLGKGSRWMEIYGLNQNVIQDPNMILVGQLLRMPKIKKGE